MFRLALPLASLLLALAAPVATARADDHEKHMQMHAGPAAGSAPIAPDTRQVIALNEEERNFVLTEMRAFLDNVQAIVEAVASGNMKSVAEAARRSGMVTMHSAPRSLMTKMPNEFRMLGMNTHAGFDSLADEASGMGDKAEVLKQLATLLSNCGACHQGYRLTTQ